MANILLLGDITGKSCVAIRMMTRELEKRGHEVMSLPTALVSNTLNLGKAETLDTTEYLLRSLALWEEMGMTFDVVSIGYITGMAQARALCAVADRLREKGARVLLDPILGDRGKKYNSITEDQVDGMRLLCEYADLIMPNATEAGLLVRRDEVPEAYAVLLSRGERSVLITGCEGSEEDEGSVVGYDAQRDCRVDVRFERVPGHHFGTGDMFSALLIDGMTRGWSLEKATRYACEGVSDALERR